MRPRHTTPYTLSVRSGNEFVSVAMQLTYWERIDWTAETSPCQCIHSHAKHHLIVRSDYPRTEEVYYSKCQRTPAAGPYCPTFAKLCRRPEVYEYHTNSYTNARKGGRKVASTFCSPSAASTPNFLDHRTNGTDYRRYSLYEFCYPRMTIEQADRRTHSLRRSGSV